MDVEAKVGPKALDDDQDTRRRSARERRLDLWRRIRAEVDGLGLEQLKTAPRSPWQNCYAEHWIFGLRRDCLDHIIAVNERQVLGVVRSYVVDDRRDATHLVLEKDTPEHRPVEGPDLGDGVALPRVGGLHHRYARELREAA